MLLKGMIFILIFNIILLAAILLNYKKTICKEKRLLYKFEDKNNYLKIYYVESYDEFYEIIAYYKIQELGKDEVLIYNYDKNSILFDNSKKLPCFLKLLSDQKYLLSYTKEVLKLYMLSENINKIC